MENSATRHDNYASALVIEASGLFSKFLQHCEVPVPVIKVFLAVLQTAASELEKLPQWELEQAFFSLMNLCREKVTKKLAGLNCSSADSEDYLQIAYLEVMERFREGKEVKNAGGLLKTSAFNNGLDERRSASRRKIAHLADPTESPSRSAGPEQIAIGKDEWERSLEIWSMNSNWLNVARLLEDGHKPADIASIMGIPPSTVRGWLAQMRHVRNSQQH